MGKTNTDGKRKVLWESEGVQWTWPKMGHENKLVYDQLITPAVSVHPSWKYKGNSVIVVQGNVGAKWLEIVAIGLDNGQPKLLDGRQSQLTEYWLHDNRELLVTTDCYDSYDGLTLIPRILKWNGSGFSDVSSEYPEYFTAELPITDSFKDIESGTYPYPYRAMALALYYGRAGRRDIALAILTLLKKNKTDGDIRQAAIDEYKKNHKKNNKADVLWSPNREAFVVNHHVGSKIAESRIYVVKQLDKPYSVNEVLQNESTTHRQNLDRYQDVSRMSSTVPKWIDDKQFEVICRGDGLTKKRAVI